ncbi:exopolyphosphatase [Photobacterium aquimaris]|uniref:Exopolyphosphatase n=1 Tax=Photobacterium aquimaris TaxID=512643 RepID=A0A2T3IJF2_9GAMM|nr:exopolyphosphatase [Photobacterium aquimaris]OBU16512.1 exopolyphosphatase [Photobacterium aquimaris]OBU18138.1 exopolyphosphatase [Photobacterium aquimaris]PSU28474.1 exopolyphosphatase [Photobacterium aquimaris]PSW02716.1 exopolyphosphatase [Photobacterium aquimaris]
MQNDNHPTQAFDAPQPRHIAALDLGSNSFHLVIARVIGQRLQIIGRYKQRLQLASGLDSQHNLSQAAIERGLACLTMFAERLHGFAPENVRIAATYTLRQARNADIFIRRAEAIMPYPIEIIAGTEEARLIYLGVAHTEPEHDKRLVIDVGGGSTELVIGSGFETDIIASKHIGCVSYHQTFFSDGKLNHANFAAAQLAARQKLETIANQYKQLGWQKVLGTSGTIKAIRAVFIAQGHHDGVITQPRLQQLITTMIGYKHQQQLVLAGLPPERQPVFAAGVAIVSAIFSAFDITAIHFSNAALREGLLYDMEQRFRHCDIRSQTATAMAQQYNIDMLQAQRVKNTALALYAQLPQPATDKDPNLTTLLAWGALLHEVGLSISYPGFHRHSAYILRYSAMPGFSVDQQTLLATLARFQRKRLKLDEMPPLTIYKRKQVYPLIRALRLAVTLNGQRSTAPQPTIGVSVNNEHWQLVFPANWLAANTLLAADLATEQQYWHKAGWKLTVGE